MKVESQYMIGDEVIPTESVKPFIPSKYRDDGTDVVLETLSEVTILKVNGTEYRNLG